MRAYILGQFLIEHAPTRITRQVRLNSCYENDYARRRCLANENRTKDNVWKFLVSSTSQLGVSTPCFNVFPTTSLANLFLHLQFFSSNLLEIPARCLFSIVGVRTQNAQLYKSIFFFFFLFQCLDVLKSAIKNITTIGINNCFINVN